MVHLVVGLTKIEGVDPPYNHNYLLGSAVYNKINSISEEAAKVLHDSPFRTAYVLSEIYRVPDRPNESWFRIGTGDSRVVSLFEKALAPGVPISVGKTSFIVHTVRRDTPVVVPGEYVTLSPILLRNKETNQSIVYDSGDYCNILQNASNLQVSKYLKKKGSVRILHFEPIAVRKRTIERRTVLAQKGRFIMDGPVDELRMLVDYGIGLSPGLAFGMIVPTESGGYTDE
ncbi:MAG: CRISPR-associated endoribonuclease Cas6 [Thermoplasmatales archaeon]